MKKVFASFLIAALLSGSLFVRTSAAALQSGSFTYFLSQELLGTEPISLINGQTFSAYLAPMGTQIQTTESSPILIEIYTRQEKTGIWGLDSLSSGQIQLILTDADCLYHISPSFPQSTQLDGVTDSGLWIKTPDQNSCQPVSATGELVDEWALNLVNQAIANGLMPSYLQGQDLRKPITRTQFAELMVQLYETVSGETLTVPEKNPFSDTSDPEVLKAYSMDFLSGLSETTFGPDQFLTREQAVVTLTRVCHALNMDTTVSVSLPFSDSSQISSWAQASTAFLTEAGILSGYTDGRFAPQDPIQRQACLILALRINQIQ